jgi:hypothetical protein
MFPWSNDSKGQGEAVKTLPNRLETGDIVRSDISLDLTRMASGVSYFEVGTKEGE